MHEGEGLVTPVRIVDRRAWAEVGMCACNHCPGAYLHHLSDIIRSRLECRKRLV